jgi:hypothetical protein
MNYEQVNKLFCYYVHKALNSTLHNILKNLKAQTENGREINQSVKILFKLKLKRECKIKTLNLDTAVSARL